MEELANKFWQKNRTKGKVVKVTDYSFWWETFPDKNGNTQTTVYMESYFLEVRKRK